MDVELRIWIEKSLLYINAVNGLMQLYHKIFLCITLTKELDEVSKTTYYSLEKCYPGVYSQFTYASIINSRQKNVNITFSYSVYK